jgi:hypothetical protein
MKKIILSILIVLLSGCSDEPIGMTGKPNRVKSFAVSETDSSSPVKPGQAEAARRYLALKHKLTLSTEAADLPQRFAAIQAECIKLGCEILVASQYAKTSERDARASLIARIPPAAFAVFFKDMQSQGKLLAHESESEDKTAEVIDIEARLKNLEALKARVLELLAKNTGNLKDMLDAEKQLAETQAQLDSINGQRRALANLTEMVHIEIDLVDKSLAAEGNWAAPVVDAASDTGAVLMKSVGVLITVVVALLPWMIVLSLLLWPVRRAWRRRKAAKTLTEK